MRNDPLPFKSEILEKLGERLFYACLSTELPKLLTEGIPIVSLYAGQRAVVKVTPYFFEAVQKVHTMVNLPMIRPVIGVIQIAQERLHLEEITQDSDRNYLSVASAIPTSSFSGLYLLDIYGYNGLGFEKADAQRYIKPVVCLNYSYPRGEFGLKPHSSGAGLVSIPGRPP